MNTQSEALRYADWLDGSSNGPMDAKHKAAAELRRLYALNAELLEVLKCAVGGCASPNLWMDFASAAIAKAQGESND